MLNIYKCIVRKKVLIIIFLLIILLSSIVLIMWDNEKIKLSIENENVNIFSESINKEIIIKDNISIYELISKEDIDNFNLKVYQLLNDKYPVHIVERILVSDVSYSTKSDYLLIEYFASETEVLLAEKFSLKVNYNEIKEYMLYSVDVKTEYVNESGYDYDPEKKTVAITFDDGPSSKYTSEILDILADNKARATFFMLGLEMDKYRSIIKAVYDSGNEIGLHGYTHKNFKRMSVSDVETELNEANKILYEVTGAYSDIVRPPYGSVSSEIIDSFNYKWILWNIDTNDWRNKNVDELVSHVVENVSDGDIILFHDIFKESVEAVELLLPLLYDMGYQVVDVSTMAKLKNYDITTDKLYGSIK